MDNNIKVSVIVITYNHEKFIKRALDSILIQKVNFKYEIIIGDDASTDKTPDILKEYKKMYPDIIKLHLNSVNLGATRNAYNLLMLAKGMYLATCEGDDYWIDKNKLQVQVDFLDSHEEYIGCCHKFKIVDEYGGEYEKWIRWIKFKPSFSLGDFNGLYLPSQPSTFVRRNIFKDKSFDYSFIYEINEMICDRTLMLFFLTYGKFFLLKNKMSAYRICRKNKQSVTNRLYISNRNYLENEYKYVDNLEKFGKSLLKNFTLRQRKIFLIFDYLFISLFTKYYSQFFSKKIEKIKNFDILINILPYLCFRFKVLLFEKLKKRM